MTREVAVDRPPSGAARGEAHGGRVAFVTGGTRGIGRAISARLKAGGYTVAAGYAGNEVAAKAAADELGLFVIKGNVSSFADCKAAIEEGGGGARPHRRAGQQRRDHQDAVLHRMTEEQWTEVIHVNLASIFNMTRNVIEGMRERNYGRIINISSINGQKGQIGQTNYSAAKAGMIGFTKALAQENAKKGMTVNTIAPGYIDTEMVSAVPQNVLEQIIAGIPVGRLGMADEIARCVAFLAAEDAGFITGATLSVNGGQYIAG